MNLLLHHFRKDLTYIRWWIIGTWIISGSILLWPLIPREIRATYVSLASLVSLVKYLMAWATVWNLLRLDSPRRDKAFFQTKPTSLIVLLRSKLLVILVLTVPLALLECIFVEQLGLHPGILNQILIFSETLLPLLTISFLVMVVSSYNVSLNTKHRRFTGLILILLFGYIAYRWLNLTLLSEFGIFSQTLRSSQTLAAQLIWTLGVLLGLSFLQPNQSSRSLRTAIEVSALSALAGWFFWPVDFVRRFTPETPQAPIAERPTQESFKVEFTASAKNRFDGLYFDRSPYGFDSRPSLRINARYRLRGLQDSWWPSIGNGFSSELFFKPDSPLFSHTELSPDKLFAKTIFRKIGIMRESAEESVHIFTLTRVDMAGKEDATKISALRGSVDFSLVRPVVLARQGLVQGRSFPISGKSITITKVKISSERIDYSLEFTGIKLALRGDDSSIRLDPIQFLAINRRHNEYLEPASIGTRLDVLGHYQCSTFDMSCVLRQLAENDSQVGTIDSDWLADAELLIIGTEHGGTFSQSFDFSNIDLSRKQ